MNKRNTALAFIFTLLVGLSVHATEENKPEPKKQTHCPVMERYEIDKDRYIDIKGYRIYTCCKGCINQIKANPDKYIKRLKDKGITIEKAPAHIPITPNESSPKNTKE